MEKNKRKKNRSRHRKKPETKVSTKETAGIVEDFAGLSLDGDLPYRVKKSDVMGRYLVAARDLPAGEILIQEEPLVVGPSQQCGLVCLGCYVPVDLDTCSRCSLCKWPLCSPHCRGLHSTVGHSKPECSLLSRVTSLDFDLEPITPLRCMLLKTTHPAKWSTLTSMESHNQVRQGLPHIWAANQKEVVDVIRNKWRMDNFSELELHTVCGILETNAFDVSYNDSKARALYPTSFLFSHDCVPNTAHTNDGDYRFRVRTSVPVPRDQPLTLTYTYIIEGTLNRREHLKASKFFDCLCARCRDPSELKTWASALVCPLCGEATLVSANPLMGDAPWRCRRQHCRGEMSAESVHELLNKLSAEVRSLDPDDVPAHESFLSSYKTTLHRNHHYNLWVKHSLAQMYGKVDGYLVPEMSNDLLLRKIVICEELLSVINILDPGMSRLRGVLLYELHAPLMVRISRQSSAAPHKAALRLTLKKVLACLREAEAILKFECAGTQEGQMGEAAGQALKEVYQWERVVGKL